MADTPSRTVTSVAASDDTVYIVCNDGTLWVFNAGNGTWIEMPPIPQPPPAPPATSTTSGTGTEQSSGTPAA